MQLRRAPGVTPGNRLREKSHRLARPPVPFGGHRLRPQQIHTKVPVADQIRPVFRGAQVGGDRGAVVAVPGDQRRQPAPAKDRDVDHIGAGLEQGLQLGQRIIPAAPVEQVLRHRPPDHADARRAGLLGQGQKLARLRAGLPVQGPKRDQPVVQQQQLQVGGLRIVTDHRQRPLRDRQKTSVELKTSATAVDRANEGLDMQGVPGGEPVTHPLGVCQRLRRRHAHLAVPGIGQQHHGAGRTQPRPPHIRHRPLTQRRIGHGQRLRRPPGAHQGVGQGPGHPGPPLRVTRPCQQPPRHRLRLLIPRQQEQHPRQLLGKHLTALIPGRNARHRPCQQVRRALRRPVRQRRCMVG